MAQENDVMVRQGACGGLHVLLAQRNPRQEVEAKARRVAFGENDRFIQTE